MAASIPASPLPRAAAPALPLEPAEFVARLDALGPFETSPHLAVAVSGGRDSLALAVLADAWARQRGGRITALIVDHGLRAESGAEAAQVAQLLDRRAIAAHVLSWRGAKPRTGLAEAARAARYRLLRDWCSEAGVLHLLLAHQQDDQAETVLMRLGDGSGIDGLAGMASLRELSDLRLLRPLLDVPRSRLTATLEALGVAWVDDPSNGNLLYLRPRLRAMANRALNQAAWAAAESHAATRRQLDRRLAAIAAERVTMYPAGWARIEGLDRLPEQIALRLLSAIVASLGGRDYRPRRAALARALQAAGAGRGATAGGCRLLPRRGGHVVAREWGGIVETIDLAPGAAGSVRPIRWDRRFDLILPAGTHGTLAALGETGRLAVLRRPEFTGKLRESLAAMPPPAARALPGLWRAGQVGCSAGLVAVGHGGRLGGGPATVDAEFRGGGFVAGFRPDRPLAAAPHALVLAGQRLI